jgi:hypothetical protein
MRMTCLTRIGTVAINGSESFSFLLSLSKCETTVNISLMMI